MESKMRSKAQFVHLRTSGYCKPLVSLTGTEVGEPMFFSVSRFISLCQLPICLHLCNNRMYVGRHWGSCHRVYLLFESRL